MDYNPKEIEEKWQAYWRENQIYKVENDTSKPKYYVLDMFPYPSGAGLHIGHPLGYIATDIFSRYKRMKGFNVLHPMGFDSFGLPAEQYAIETGQHPAITTAQNIINFKSQLAKIGFNHDWEREVQTSSPEYYKWTQWIFQQIFQSWFNYDKQSAEPIETLIAEFDKNGNTQVNAACDEDTPLFSAEEWNDFSETKKYEISLKYRLTYVADSYVNWCPALGTVLANDEIKDGLSERGGYPVERKKMRQWMMRITAYADRLLQGIEEIDWSESLKEQQRNWIGKSIGCEINFKSPLTPEGGTITPSPFGEGWGGVLTAFTTRIDTIFGVIYLALAPEHEWISQLTTENQKDEVEKYVTWAKNRSERERQTEVKTVSGAFTGSYAINPFNNEQIPIWVADYVLAGYGTGVVMGVPSSDDRDFRFATHFNLPIIHVIEGTKEMENPTEKKYGKMINSDFLDGLDTKKAIEKAIAFVENNQIGKKKINFRLRDAVFSRQRYWGEPVPIKYDENGFPQLISASELPLVLPEIDEYKPTEEGEPPLARAKDWIFEQTTMPGWAGSSWYFLRYSDAKNDKEFASKAATDYWNQVDLYVGGTEHAVGHLLYSRFWTHFLYDRGFISFKEPFKKLINQGMIQGESALIYRGKGNMFFSFNHLDDIRKLQQDEIDLKNIIREITERSSLEVFDSFFSVGGVISCFRAMNNFTEYERNIYKKIPFKDYHIFNLIKEEINVSNLRDKNNLILNIEDFEKNPSFVSSEFEFEFLKKSEDFYCERSDNNIITYRVMFTNIYLSAEVASEIKEIREKFINLKTKVNKILNIQGIEFNGENRKPAEEIFIEVYKEGIFQEYFYDSLIYVNKEPLHVTIDALEGNNTINLVILKKWRPDDYQNAEFILAEDGKFYCETRIEKLSKRFYNAVNPDEVVDRYSADTLRLYEMFLGPLEQSKPWNINGIDGTFKFLKKLCRLYPAQVNESTPISPLGSELKALHKCIKGVTEDLERYSFNTPVSKFMVCVNELLELKCNNKEIFESLIRLLAPFAPHITEELWHQLGNEDSIHHAEYPTFNPEYLKEDDFEYPIQINGKLRFNLSFPLDMPSAEIQEAVLANENVQKYLEGKDVKKFILVPKKIINVVV